MAHKQVESFRRSRLGMEAALLSRDKVGVQDFVLLEDYTNIDAFLDNLRKRFQENLIYTYIGQVLVSVNPYKNLGIYTDDVIQTYKNVNFYELPPHIFAIGDTAYRSVKNEFRDQCILISGESGAGKTEASKKVLHYIASSSTHSQDVDRVKDRLLQSNPILEAFGNAKTNRNDNSSRFGKYMDIQFDYRGAPVGGVVINYLLEKSRVCHQAPGERNFHIFYQLLRGASPELLNQLHLSKEIQDYYYLNQPKPPTEVDEEEEEEEEEGECDPLRTIDDEKNFTAVKRALKVCDFTDEEQQALFSVVASVLHLGNISYEEEEGGSVTFKDEAPVDTMAKLLGCPEENLKFALTNRSIFAESKKVSSPLSLDQANYARDALGKGIYERLFKWIIAKLNESLTCGDKESKAVLGLLDIYGFEVFEKNCFEQFCINYCNEKLQQLFIQLTLKSEQDEYMSEGIEWEPVQYFNNKVICDLVEAKPIGMISLLDEECLRPGDVSDMTFLAKMSKNLGHHKHFLSHQTGTIAQRKTIERNEFRLQHYAGEVTYTVDGFVDKNNDLLFRDLKEAMIQTTNLITATCFQQSEIDSRKRPETAGSQFKLSMSQLINILNSKQPSYIRCIKPNDDKRPGVFSDQIVLHQVKYLGLMENIRVRRAGFAYRREYQQFLKRYKPLCPKTWPNYHGPAREGVRELCQHLTDLYDEDDYKLGRTKIFIRFPRVLFATEDALGLKKQELATMIQATFKGYYQKKIFRIKRNAVTTIGKYWRREAAKRLLARRKQAVLTIRRFIEGFIKRKQPECKQNKFFVDTMRCNFLLRLAKNLPKTVLDKSWPKAPEMLEEVSRELRRMNMENMVRTYCKYITADRKWQLEQKVVGERLFKDQKKSYPDSVPKPYEETRLLESLEPLCTNVFKKTIKPEDETIKYAISLTKYDRHGYSMRNRVLIMTDKCVYVVDEKTFKLKDRIPFENIKGISVSSFSDGILVLHTNTELNGNKIIIPNLNQNDPKGDLILYTDHLIEVMVKIAMLAKIEEKVSVVSGIITHVMSDGKQGQVEFTTGDKMSIVKSKSGALSVVATH